MSYFVLSFKILQKPHEPWIPCCNLRVTPAILHVKFAILGTPRGLAEELQEAQAKAKLDDYVFRPDRVLGNFRFLLPGVCGECVLR